MRLNDYGLWIGYMSSIFSLQKSKPLIPLNEPVTIQTFGIDKRVFIYLNAANMCQISFVDKYWGEGSFFKVNCWDKQTTQEYVFRISDEWIKYENQDVGPLICFAVYKASYHSTFHRYKKLNKEVLRTLATSSKYDSIIDFISTTKDDGIGPKASTLLEELAKLKQEIQNEA